MMHSIIFKTEIITEIMQEIITEIMQDVLL